MRAWPAPDRRGALSWRLLWTAALAVALVNTLAVIRRAPILKAQSRTPDEIAAEAAARWFNRFPPNTHCLLLLSHRNDSAPWFQYRVAYWVYPRRLDTVWDRTPAPTRLPVIAFGAAAATVPAAWPPDEATARVKLFGRPAVSRLQTPASMASDEVGKRRSVLQPLRAIFSFVALCVPALLGLLLLRLTASPRAFSVWWGNLAVAHLAGAAALTWLVTIGEILSGRLLVWPVYVATIALGGAWVVVRTRGAEDRLPLLPQPPSGAKLPPYPPRAGDSSVEAAGGREGASNKGRGAVWELIYPFSLLLLALAAIATIVTAWLLGLGWDGYAIWQLKAKAFFTDGTFAILRDTAHFHDAHLDYPLLVPLHSWWVYAHLGYASDRWAQLCGSLFALDLVAVFAAVALGCNGASGTDRTYGRRLSRAGENGIAWAGVALCATLPLVITHAVSGFADVPMAAYFLATGVFLARVAAGKGDAAAPLAWMLAGLAVVKNEGLLACVGAVSLLGVQVFGYSGLRVFRCSGAGRVAFPVLAAGLSYSPWLWIRHSLSLRSDLLPAGHAHAFGGVEVVRRATMATGGIASQLLRVGPWMPCWGLLAPLAVCAVYACVMQLRAVRLSQPGEAGRGERPRFVVPAALCSATCLLLLACLQLVGYTAIYTFTPHDEAWHIRSSVDRLVLHVAPALLLAAVCAWALRPVEHDQSR